MLKVILFSITALSISVYAQEHKAHVHGAAQVSMGFDGSKGKIEFKAPAETVFGFEHEARSKKDREAKDKGLQALNDNISEMIAFDKELACEIKMEASQVNQEKDHADVEVEYAVTCQKPVAGSTITFNFKKGLSRIKKVKVEVIADEVQKSLEVKKNGESLELK
ncbi:hypothetical protein AZI86_17880 [Bdellovibrio bacteriovorus]|uniref:DUF2796 domain-containing protein n=1 Tax=Bdellovibrio bacteriovorus TaxID=959 RepID=A0A150WF44_BDEBC|nr:DUF2796 domain-containing protein [Bdellovibrio bacteriovorus]KYG61574.1 hypothetical protein AZI86_17880 [Bdellovibrio bacteriovorus]